MPKKINKKKIYNDVMDCFYKSEQYMKPRFELFNRWFRLGEGIPLSRPRQSWMSNLFVPTIPYIIDTIKKKLCTDYFTTNRIVRLKPRLPEFSTSSKIQEDLLYYQVPRMLFHEKYTDDIEQTLFYGYSPKKIYWRFDDKPGVMYDDPDFGVIDPMDFFWQPGSEHIADAKWCIQRGHMSLDELKYLEKQGILFDINLLKQGDSEEVPSYKKEKAEISGQEEQQFNRDNEEPEVIEWWGTYNPYGDSEEAPCLFTVINRRYLVRSDCGTEMGDKHRYPFEHENKPFVMTRINKRAKRMEGRGFPEMLEGINLSHNELRNMRIDNIKLVTHKRVTLRDGATISQQQLQRVGPGGVIKVGDHDDVKPFDLGDVHVSTYREEDLLQKDAQNRSGVTDFMRGQLSDTAADTATGIQIATSQGNIIFQFDSKYIALTSLVPMFNMFADLNQQFIDRPKVVRIVGANNVEYLKEMLLTDEQGKPYGDEMNNEYFVKIAKENIKGDFDFIINIDPGQLMQRTLVNQTTAAIKEFGLNPITGPLLNTKELLTRLFTIMDWDDIDSVFAQQPPQGQLGVAPPVVPPSGGAPIPTSTSAPVSPVPIIQQETMANAQQTAPQPAGG